MNLLHISIAARSRCQTSQLLKPFINMGSQAVSPGGWGQIFRFSLPRPVSLKRLCVDPTAFCSAAMSSPPTAKAGGVPKAAPSKASALGGSAPVAAQPKTVSAPPSSAAAVVEMDRKPMTAAERLSGTGSALAKGVGAKAEPQAKPKAKAKTTAVPNRPLPQETMGTAPRAVLNMVSAKPAPATQGGSTGYASSNVGPARAYAKTAAGNVGGEVPKAGPPAVAMGRAMAEGRPAVTMVNGKPVTTITKKYQLVFVTGGE